MKICDDERASILRPLLTKKQYLLVHRLSWQMNAWYTVEQDFALEATRKCPIYEQPERCKFVRVHNFEKE
jgi:hypothetical protein